jgi:exosortase
MSIQNSLVRTLHALLLGVVGLALIWAYTPTLTTLVRRWAYEPQASHGAIVPFFALAVLWVRRDRYPEGPAQPTWWGFSLILVGAGCRIYGTVWAYDWFDGFSLLPTLAGLALLARGWSVTRWLLPGLAVLLFMLPLPYTAESFISAPLQRFVTQASAYLLLMGGLPAVTEGNILNIGPTRIGVLEACNGLGMMGAFLALCTTAGMIVKRPLWQKIVLFLSAIPVALLMNILRVTMTGLVTYIAGNAPGKIFHDRSGWFMMPIAVALVWLEMQLLERVFLPPAAAARAKAASRMSVVAVPFGASTTVSH